MRHLFLDFDGTLVDSQFRQYELFVELIGKPVLSFAEYWKAKGSGLNQSDMLLRYAKHTSDETRAFKSKWMEAIEDSRRLEKDFLIDGAPRFLNDASKHFALYLVTGRQHRERLINQLKQLCIEVYFTDILNTAQSITKADLVRLNVDVGHDDIFIGDTGEDILAGKELGTFTVGVTSGAIAAGGLGKYRPNLIVGSVAELVPQSLGLF